MPKHLIITIISDDKPGIVKTLADTVARFQGNWLESRLAHLAGKFAGVIRIAVEEAEMSRLKQALEQLREVGMQLQIEASEERQPTSTNNSASFSALGPDRPGIVKEISQAFAEYQINVEELNTHCSSMPYSGEPLFEAEGRILAPPGTDLDKLHAQLDAIADALAIDIRLQTSS